MENVTEKVDAENVEAGEKDAKTDASTDRLETESETKQPEDSKQETTPELLEKIKKQVEFYFGDVNMQRDKFLIEQTRLDDGWVPMTVMLNFKLLASLSKDIDAILKALEDSELIEISEDRKKIRRSPDKPLPAYDDEFRKAQEARTVYLKGFPLDSTMEQLKEHFDSLNTVENIIMRKYKKGKEFFFKGSIFIQFRTLEDAKKFMEQDSIKYKDVALIKMWSVDYTEYKEKEKEERRLKKGKTENTDEKKTKNNTQREVKFPKGCILHFSNLSKPISRDNLKQKLLELDSRVAYVDYNPGDEEGWIRLHEENSAADLLEKLDSQVIKIDEVDVKCELLDNEKELAYLIKVQEDMTSFRQKKGFKGRKNFKRRHSPSRNGNNKRAHVDS